MFIFKALYRALCGSRPSGWWQRTCLPFPVSSVYHYHHEKASATTKWQDLHADEPKTILGGMQKGAEGKSLGQVVFWTHDTHLSQIGNTSLDHLVCIINMLGITVLGVGEEISHL